jgi:CBS domain-containing protein
MKVQYLYASEAVTCQATASLADAATILHRGGIGAVPIVDQRDRLIGILSERDLTRAIAEKVDPNSVEVLKYASRSVSVAMLDDDSWIVDERMLDSGMRHLPVVDGDRVVGMVSMRDLLAVETWA